MCARKKEWAMRGFVSLLDFSCEELTAILDRADALREDWRAGTMPRCLGGRRVGLWFYGQGFRNRVAFELGAEAMGAAVACIPGELGVHEPLEDIGPYLDSWFDLLVVRAKRHDDLVFLAEDTRVPVINARTDRSHPCEIMGDLQFTRQRRGSLDGLKVAFVGETTNLCMSWLEAAARFPIQVTQIAPEGYGADESLVAELMAGAEGSIRLSCDMSEIDSSVDLVYTDCWPKSDDEGGKEKIRKAFLPYRIELEHLSRLRDSAIFLPCPPVTRGQELSREAMESRLCMNHSAKEFLLHGQNAILESVMERTGL
jgi:ornithine carbamoyltransferase